ncbi:hypothetical protein COL922a_009388 [Colletotrichum nupharicola]|nr:hypothetical protein COL922a_009388 [Colletotrichum nupharicola]
MMHSAQKIHLQPTYSAKKPPAAGPRTGPRSGAREYTDTALPLSAGGATSAIVPPPMDSGAAPAHPLKKRNTSRTPRFGETAQAALQARKSTFEMLYAGYRP